MVSEEFTDFNNRLHYNHFKHNESFGMFQELAQKFLYSLT